MNLWNVHELRIWWCVEHFADMEGGVGMLFCLSIYLSVYLSSWGRL